MYYNIYLVKCKYQMKAAIEHKGKFEECNGEYFK